MSRIDNLIASLVDTEIEALPSAIDDKMISVDQRVDLLLGAMLGFDRKYTEEERTIARARILDAMAESIARQLTRVASS